ncbi:lysozyme [Methylobacterium sp. sgz302541]|uniref:lysozyme n=1 Tax=unclassified Methylobacterium TaxID=2615210 RepID=UPI003D33E8E5
MQLSPVGRAAIEAREGCRLTAYRDSVGVWTIGYGHTTAAGGLVVKADVTITQAQADAMFAVDVEKYADPVRKALGPKLASCSPEQFDAFVSIAYNIGPVGFAHATFLRKFMAGDVAGCAEAILMWNKPAAIVSRRQGERDQFLTPYAKAMPRARRGDLRPVTASLPPSAPSLPPKPADPMAPMTTPKPAPTGGLLRSGAQAAGAGTRGLLNGLYDLIHATLARKA